MPDIKKIHDEINRTIDKLQKELDQLRNGREKHSLNVVKHVEKELKRAIIGEKEKRIRKFKK